MAIDFKLLMREERRRARERHAPPSAAAAALLSEPRSPPPPLPQTDVDWELPSRNDRPEYNAEAHAVDCGVRGIAHIAEWCSAEEEAAMLRCTDGAPARRWTQLRGRRLQSLGGTPSSSDGGMTREPLPSWVQSVCDELVRCGVFPRDQPPNHVLLNEYRPGQGIDPHKDGPLYAPRVAILSLSSRASFLFLEDSVARAERAALLLPPRGLLLFRDEAYTDMLHTVPQATHDDVARPSLVRLDLPGRAGACSGEERGGGGGEQCGGGEEGYGGGGGSGRGEESATVSAAAGQARCGEAAAGGEGGARGREEGEAEGGLRTEGAAARVHGGRRPGCAAGCAAKGLPRQRRVSLTVRHVLRSSTPEEQRDAGRFALTEPLPLWSARQRLARWLDAPGDAPGETEHGASPAAPAEPPEGEVRTLSSAMNSEIHDREVDVSI